MTGNPDPPKFALTDESIENLKTIDKQIKIVLQNQI